MLTYEDAEKALAARVESYRRLGILHDPDTEAEVRGRIAAVAEVFGLKLGVTKRAVQALVLELEPLGTWDNAKTGEGLKVTPCRGGYRLVYSAGTNGVERMPRLSSLDPRELMLELVEDGFEQRR